MSAVGFIGPSNPASNLLVRYGVVKVQPALWLPTIVDRMAKDVGSVLLVRSELSKPCAFLSGEFSEVPVGASIEKLAAIPATRRLLIPAAAASSPPWPTLVVTGLGPNLAEWLAVDGEHVLSVDDLLRGDPLATPAQVKESAAPVLRGPGVRITPPVGHTTVREKRETSSVSAASLQGPSSHSSVGPVADDHHVPLPSFCESEAGFEHLQSCSWRVPGGTGQVVRDPHGDEWGVVLRSPHLRQVLGELKALQALRDSGLPEALGLGSGDPVLHVVVAPEGLAEIPPVFGLRRWCCVDGCHYPVAD